MEVAKKAFERMRARRRTLKKAADTDWREKEREAVEQLAAELTEAFRQLTPEERTEVLSRRRCIRLMSASGERLALVLDPETGIVGVRPYVPPAEVARRRKRAEAAAEDLADMLSKSARI